MELFKQIGFTPDQIAIYSTLLEYRRLPASRIASLSKVSRVITYRILGQFVDMGIVEKIDIPKSVALFGVKDPETLKKLIDIKKADIESFSNACETLIQSIRPKYNLLTDKPGIAFYEGMEGIKKVVEDNLYTEGEIYMYVDIDAVLDHFPELNASYVQKREKLGIKKKVLMADTPRARAYIGDRANTLTDTKFVGKEKIPFGSAMQIYDNKISYITIGKHADTLIGIIIEDERIANMHRYFFESLYEAL